MDKNTRSPEERVMDRLTERLRQGVYGDAVVSLYTIDDKRVLCSAAYAEDKASSGCTVVKEG